jgi:transcription elongation GreA/GreB family factor
LKEKLFKYCQDYLFEKESELSRYLDNAQESLEGEQKSSAGDKHETSRAMVQIEIDKYGKQLAQTKKLGQVLNLMKPETETKSITVGSLVATNNGTFYIGIPIGPKKIEGETIFFISMASPIGQLMQGLKTNDTFEMNGKQFTVLAVN